MRYLRRAYSVPDELREVLTASLWEAGTLGVEDGPELVGWFAGPAPEVALPPGARLRCEEWIEGEDWLAAYRDAARPIAVGDRLWIDPREPGSDPLPVPDHRLALRVPARTAFGTGSHASTRLARRLLERQPLAGAWVLDVGTGSGILSLAARALGARRAAGFDLDPAAALLAGQHARMNGVRGAAFWAGGVESLAPAARFGVVVANALPHELLPVAGAVGQAVAPGGRLIVSGVLAAEAGPVLAAWRVLGLEPVDEQADEEWVAWTLARGAEAR
jgi:ribosomal protein L11 methyltransferase